MNQTDHSFFTTDMLWSIGLLVLIFAVLKALVLPRMADALNRRARAIEQEVASAREAREQAEEERQQFRDELQAAEQDVERMIAESEVRVRQQHDEMMQTVREEIAGSEAAFHEETEAKRLKAMQDIRAEAAKSAHDGDESDATPPTRH